MKYKVRIYGITLSVILIFLILSSNNFRTGSSVNLHLQEKSISTIPSLDERFLQYLSEEITSQVIIKFETSKYNELKEYLASLEIIDSIHYYANFPNVLLEIKSKHLQSFYNQVRAKISGIWLSTKQEVIPETSYEALKLSATTDSQYVPPWNLTNAHVLWNEGFEGEGSKIAIVDSGIYHHSDFSDRIIYEESFVTKDNGFDNPEGVNDQNGHGTHVASLAAGNGTLSG